MNKKEDTPKISKLAFSRVKRTLNKKSSIFAILLVTIIICFALALFFPESLLLSVPFLVIPSIFAYMSINSAIDSELVSPTRAYFLLFKSYFSNHFRGSFRVIWSYLKSLLIFIAITIVVSIVGVTIIYSVDKEFVRQFISLSSSLSTNEGLNELQELMFNNRNFSMLIKLTTYLAEGAGFIVFLHFVLSESEKCYFNLLGTAPVFARDLNIIFKAFIKKNRKQYAKDHFKGTWFLLLLLILGFSSGILLGEFVIKQSQSVNVVFGYFMSLVFILPFIPYYFDFTLILFKKYHQAFINTFVELSIESLNELKKKQDISEEKEKEILGLLDEQKEIAKNNKENSKDEKNHD